MSYRYARSNGQFLESKFIDPIADATSQNFRSDQSYDLNKNFVSGTNAQVNSFVVKAEKLKGYEVDQGNLLSWWRLGNKDDANTELVEDSSGNNIWLTGSSASTRPTIDSGDTPSRFISNNSFLFDGVDDKLTVTTSKLVFGNGTTDTPFSISAWIKINSLSDTQAPIYFTDVGGNTYLYVRILTSGELQLIIKDNATGGYLYARVLSALLSKINVWTHVTFTYNGNGHHNGIEIYIDGSLQSNSNSTVGTYNALSSTATVSVTLGEFGSWELMGNMAEVAIWNKVLTASDISNLYGAKNAGAYWLVRDFSKESIDNDTRVIGIQSERKGLSTSDLPSDIMNQFKQGINVKTHKQLSEYNGFKIRPNSSFMTT